MNDFGERLKDLRRSAGITQNLLAERLNLHPQTVSKWERGLSEPDISQLGDLAAALGVSIEKLCGAEQAERTYSGKFGADRLSKTISDERTAAGESQEHLAACLNVSADAVSRWERGLTCPDIRSLTLLAEHFGMCVSQLWCGGTNSQAVETAVKSEKNRRIVFFTAAAIFMFLAALAVFAAVVYPGVFALGESAMLTITVNGQSVQVGKYDWFMPDTPELSGYDFKEWQDVQGNKVEFPRRVEQGEIYKPVFVPREYKIDYWLNGGTLKENVQSVFTVESGEIRLPVPEKEGEKFEGWYVSPDYSGQPVESICCAASDVRLYAKWSNVVYSVRYELGGGVLENDNPESVSAGQTHLLCSPVRQGYVFLGWFDSPDGGNKYEYVGGDWAANLTLYARWQRTDAQYGIYYDLGGGTALGKNPDTIGAGEVYLLYGAAKRGYVFAGWNIRADGSGEYVDYLRDIGEPLVLYAIFEPETYTVRYVYEGIYEGGEANPNYISYGESVTLKSVYLYGYEFVGWYDASEGGEKITVINADNIERLTTLYARFAPIEFTISLDAGEGVLDTPDGKASRYDFIVTAEEEFTLPQGHRDGYSFLGWMNDAGVTITVVNRMNIADMRLTAIWENEITYRISYELDGGTEIAPNPREAAYGEALPLFDAEKPGFMFLGWYDNAEGKGSRYYYTPSDRKSDLTLYALWQEIHETGSTDEFSYSISGAEAVISGYCGELKENGNIVIPSYIGGRTVVGIEKLLPEQPSANLRINAVVIPDTVVTLGEGAFACLTINEKLVIPASVTEIGEVCFGGTEAEIEFAEGSALRVVGEKAFYAARISNVLTLPDGVTAIKEGAFEYCICPGIILPESLRNIETLAFANISKRATNLAAYFEIYLPASVRYVEADAFAGARVYTDNRGSAAAFMPGWDNGADVVTIYDEVSGVTLDYGDRSEFVFGKTITLPSPRLPGKVFIGWKYAYPDGTDGIASGLFIPRCENTVLTAVFADETGRNRLMPAAIAADKEYEVILSPERDYFFTADVAADRIIVEIELEYEPGELRNATDLPVSILHEYDSSGNTREVWYIKRSDGNKASVIVSLDDGALFGIKLCADIYAVVTVSVTVLY